MERQKAVSFASSEGHRGGVARDRGIERQHEAGGVTTATENGSAEPRAAYLHTPLATQRAEDGSHHLRPADELGITPPGGRRLPICGRCDGCGRIADHVNGGPWSAWQRSASFAVVVGAVRPRSCPDCGGSGEAVHP